MTKFLAYLRRHLFKTPQFWRHLTSGRTAIVQTKLLKPVGRLYGRIVTWRATRPAQFTADMPVICVGNFTLGGSGKTPTVHLVATILKACGKKPAILLRGYGGTATGPLRIDVTQHSARLVGDEALLHVHVAPTWVSRNRANGAKAIMATGDFDCIIMDDGAQNPQLHKDMIINVVDGGVGIGNGLVFPAGPLREEIVPALSRSQAVMVIGNDRTGITKILQQRMSVIRKPVFNGQIILAEPVDHLQTQKLLAFAGIGRPDKFYQTLRDQGLTLVKTKDFPDHHPYSGNDIKTLAIQATALDAHLLTTTKDWVRIPAGYQHLVEFLSVRLDVPAIDDLTQLLLSAWR